MANISNEPNLELQTYQLNTWSYPENSLKNASDKNQQLTVSIFPKSGKTTRKYSRPNAWGEISYADIIIEAILTSPERRLTLDEIYCWIVENIPYFKNQGECKSSVGWKNSIRHNLSLRKDVFSRVPHENPGKSSWWMINPTALSRWSSEIETVDTKAHRSKKEKSCIKKKEDQLRTACMLDKIPDSPLPSSLAEGKHKLPDDQLRSLQFTDFQSHFNSSVSSFYKEEPTTIPNEYPGKSSWWMINPAALLKWSSEIETVDTKAHEKKDCVKKKEEQLRTSCMLDKTPDTPPLRSLAEEHKLPDNQLRSLQFTDFQSQFNSSVSSSYNEEPTITPNENPEKCPWLMIPPAAFLKWSSEMEALAMETHKSKNQRGRVKEKLEQLRTMGLWNKIPGTPFSSFAEQGYMLPDYRSHGFQFSDFQSQINSSIHNSYQENPTITSINQSS